MGLSIGLIAGIATESLAGFGKKGWERFGPMFQQGYVAGFIDAVRMAKSRSPESYLARNYPIPAAAKAVHWAHAVKQIYSEKRFEKLYLPDVLQIAAQRLSARMGAQATYSDPGLESMRRMVEARHKALIERMKKLKSEGKLVEGAPLPVEKTPLTPEQRLQKARERFAADLDSKAPAWSDMGNPVRRGFIVGFNECVGIAKTTEPDGFLARNYEVFSKVDKKQKHWLEAMQKIYGKDDAGHILEPAAVAVAWAGKSLASEGATVRALSSVEVEQQRERWRRALSHGLTPYVEPQPGDAASRGGVPAADSSAETP